MTRLYNDPARFADEALEGFVAAHADVVRAVSGGVVRADVTRDGRAVVVVGGGSGHYPAFAGYVGGGVADGAVVGNVFASPSTRQVVSVAAACDRGGGVLLMFGNYAGDVLNFTAAEAELESRGIPCRHLAVTDDISSAPAGERNRRRGVAGDLIVFKIAGAAALAGHPLERVHTLAIAANDATRSYGVAFSGCTLPGASTPLFDVPPGVMALGLGVHGEPGTGDASMPTADELAELLVRSLLSEMPDGVVAANGSRAAVVLNGLGAVKYEELFVVYRAVCQRLNDAGVTIVAPLVGEFITSFDMAGLSLSVCWLNPELEELWLAPARCPGVFRSGALTAPAIPAPAPPPQPPNPNSRLSAHRVPPSSDDSRACARRALAALRAVRDALGEAADELGRIDAVAGDGDHGIGMLRGASAALEAAEEAVGLSSAGLGTTVAVAADAWADSAGGTSGALWGAGLRAAAEVLGDLDAPDFATVSHAVHAAMTTIAERGGARVGDKTMLDALVPFDDELSRAATTGVPLGEAWRHAARTAREAAAATAALAARTGRARTHGERSVGTPDAGAISLGLVVEVIGDSAAMAADGQGR